MSCSMFRSWTRQIVIRILLVSFLLGPAALVAEELRIGSWNIQHLGWGENKSYPALARIASQFDVLAIQELMNEEALDTLRDRLASKTGVEWTSLNSHRLGPGRYQEKYAFLWRTDTVEYLDGAVVYLDDADLFVREPFSARFAGRESGRDFVLATVHILYGERVGDRTPEIRALADYWQWLEEIYPDTAPRRILAGDFNLRPDHPAWQPLRQQAQSLITEGATTLSTRDRRYANLYDNLWLPRDTDLVVRDAGILEFPVLLTETTNRYWSHEKARRHVSDHAPVYMLLGDVELYPLRTGALDVPSRRASSTEGDRAEAEPPCIDLDRASRDELTDLIHIGDARAGRIIDGRPWSDLEALTRIRGLSEARIADIREQGRVCE